MRNGSRQNERLVALVLVAALAFNVPVLSLFDSPAPVFGIPVLYLYIFLAWGALIGLIRSVMRGPRRSERDRNTPAQKR